jgi:uncharacterized protein (TIGR00266 family)
MSGIPEWYVAVNGQSVGPMSIDELVAKLPEHGGPQALIYGPGVAEWKPASSVTEVAQRLAPSAVPPMPAAPGVMATARPGGKVCDEIDYEIHGEEMQYVEITLDPNEMVIGEAGVMMYMTNGIQMNTVMGDPSEQNQGVMGKLFSAGKRVLTGESLFVTTFTASSNQRESVGFAAPYPGKLLPMHLDQLGGELICQKDSFVCAARGTKVGIAFQKKIGAGLFGGEGFIMQRLTGDGIAIVHAGGNIMQRDLKPGETLRVDTGCLVALQPSVNYDIQFVGGIKNTLFGGEGLFFATLQGPGRVWLQSLPFSRFVGRIAATLPSNRGGGTGEGSILGSLGGMLGGE